MPRTKEPKTLKGLRDMRWRCETREMQHRAGDGENRRIGEKASSPAFPTLCCNLQACKMAGSACAGSGSVLALRTTTLIGSLPFSFDKESLSLLKVQSKQLAHGTRMGYKHSKSRTLLLSRDFVEYKDFALRAKELWSEKG